MLDKTLRVYFYAIEKLEILRKLKLKYFNLHGLEIILAN